MRSASIICLVLAAGIATASAFNPIGGSDAAVDTPMTAGECTGVASGMETTILKLLVPCLGFELSPAVCCDNIKSLVGPGGMLQYCLCDETFFQELNAKAAMFSLDVSYIGASCNDLEGLKTMIPYVNNAYCPTP